MEINQINNSGMKEKISTLAIKTLLSNQIITQEDLTNIRVDFGYIFTKEDGMLEALLYVLTKSQNKYFFAAQNGKLMMLNINEEFFNETVSNMKNLHECLKSYAVEETNTQKERREKNNELLSKNNIVTNKNLLCLHNDEQAKTKSLDEMCRRAVASLIVIQIACDINNGNYEESKEFFVPMLKKYNVLDCLNSKEKRIIDGTYSKQDAIDIDWEYEAFWALVWYLGLVSDISDASKLCDCPTAISFIRTSNSLEDFKSKCNPRSMKELLDMQDLYYRYHWAINEKRVNPNANIGNINLSNVIERRRALEWILSDKYDWYEIEMHA